MEATTKLHKGETEIVKECMHLIISTIPWLASTFVSASNIDIKPKLYKERKFRNDKIVHVVHKANNT